MQITTQGILRLASLARLTTIGAAIARLMRRSRPRRNAALSAKADEEVGSGGVRAAGPGAMRDPPRRWSERDEALDESFPASDPPARY